MPVAAASGVAASRPPASSPQPPAAPGAPPGALTVAPGADPRATVTTPDTIAFTCSACGHNADFPKAQAGKAIYCPKCQAAQVIRTGNTDRFTAERIPTGRIAKAEPLPGTDRIARGESAPVGDGRIDFLCGACNHNARISAALAGQPVRCPSCGTVQLAGVAGMRVVRLDGSGKLPFTCSACNYQARLNPDYAGKAIRCPKCQAAQVVPRILRDPTGAQEPVSGSGRVVKNEPGTGSLRRTATGSYRRDETAARSEPSAALRTPAGGIAVPTPMTFATPAPGSLGSGPLPPPPPVAGSSAAPVPAAAPPAPAPMPPPPPLRASASTPTPLPLPAAEEGGAALDLGDSPAADRPRTGGVVRRSGRMAAVRTPTPSPGEPTLEPARAVQPEPDEPAPRPISSATMAAQPPRRAGPLVPVLAGLAGLFAIIAIVLGVMYSSSSSTVASLSEQVEKLRTAEDGIRKDAAAALARATDAEASRTVLAQAKEEVERQLDQSRRDAENLKVELERLRAERAASGSGDQQGPKKP